MTRPPPADAVPPTPEAAASERRIVSVLFADLVGFTPLAESLDAEDVAAVQDRYFDAVRDAVSRHGGVLEKFIGDAAMAVFGVPAARDDDAERAVRAGLAVVAAVERLGADLGLEVQALQVRVGVNTGEVVHATAGPDRGRVTGDAVNTAARLQAAAPVGGVLLGMTTALAVAEAIEVGPPSALTLKGKAEPVPAAVALGVRPQRSRELAMGGLRAPLLGRADDLARLRADVADASAGPCSLRRLVLAPPGAGKSRLLDALRSDLAARADLCLRVARFRADDPRPFGALADLVSAGELSAAVSGTPADDRRTVARAALQALAAGSRAEDGDRAARFSAWLDGLAALAAGRTEVWLLEDLHWAGPDVPAFLDAALRAPAGAGRLVLVTARPALADREPAWCEADPGPERQARVRRLDLGGLSPGATAELVRALVGDALPQALLQRVVSASDGNCLFVEELLRSWAGVGLLQRDGLQWRLTAAAERVEVPPTVQAVYAAQLDDLPPEARRLARRGAVAGRRVPLGALEALGLAPSAEVLPSLVRRDVFSHPAPDPLLGPAWTYRHALLRDAGYAGLTLADRAALHVRLATWLPSLVPEEPGRVAEAVAEHYAAAVDAAPRLAAQVAPGLDRAAAQALAARWFEQAGEQALAAGAQAAAVRLFVCAAERSGAEPTLERSRRRRRAGTVAALVGRMGEAHDQLAQAMADARARREDPGARDALALAAAAASRVQAEQLRFEEARALAEAVRAEIGPGPAAGPAGDIADAWLGLRAAQARHLASGDAADLLPAARRSLATARAQGERDLELEALAASTLAETDPLALDEAAVALAAAAQAHGRWDLVVRAWRLRAVVAHGAGADPQPWLEAARRVAASRALHEPWAWVHVLEAEIAFERGDLVATSTAARAALDVAVPHDCRRAAVRAWFLAVPAAVAAGDRPTLQAAADWFEAARPHFPRTPYGLLHQAAIDIRLHGAGCAPAPALPVEVLLPSFRDRRDGAGWIDAGDTVVRAWLAAGRLDDATAAVEAIERATPADSPLALGALHLLRARLAAAREPGPAVQAELDRAEQALAGGRWAGWSAQVASLKRHWAPFETPGPAPGSA